MSFNVTKAEFDDVRDICDYNFHSDSLSLFTFHFNNQQKRESVIDER